MKTKIQFLPVIFFASLLIYSCANSDSEAKKMSTNSPDFEKAACDSAAAPQDYSSDLKNETETTVKDEEQNKVTLEDQTQTPAENLQKIISSSAARPTKLDSTHRFIRTGDLKFRVKNVANSTYYIENLTAHFEGYVADTKLTSQMQSLTEIPVSSDSSLETMKYIVMNTITLRIPSENLDTTLKCLVPLIDYLDYRNINMRDITLQILANKLAQNRLGRYNSRLSNDVDKSGPKLHDAQSAEQSMLNAQAGADNAMLDNLKQEDAIRYSTVTLYIYQRETIRQELVKREKTVEAYEPGLGPKMHESLMAGWHGLQNFLMLVVILWPLWLIGIFTYVLVKWLLKRNKIVEEKK